MVDRGKAEIIYDTIAALQEAGSNTTRTHLQKLIYMASRLRLVEPTAFRFVLHLYGPYSFELDETILELLSTQDIASSSGPGGMGASFKTSHGQANPKIAALASWLGRRGVRDLEAITTVAFVTDRDGHDVVEEVRRIKPHLLVAEVERAQRELLEKEREFVTS